MQFLVYVALSLGLCAAASPIQEKRAVSDIVTALATVNTRIATLNTAINNFNGGTITNALPIATASNNVDVAVKAATTSITSTGALNAADSQTVISSSSSTGTNVQNVLKNLVSKKTQLIAVGAKSIVQSQLATLKKDTDTLLAALLANVDSTHKAAVTATTTTIDAAFATTITAFA